MLKNCFNKMNVRRVFVFLIVVCVVNLLVLLYKLNMASAPDASLVRHTRDKDSEIYEDWTEPFLYPRQMRDQVFIVCLVYTAVERRDQRKAIRETWASRRLWDNKRVLVYFALEESNITSNEIFVEEINKNNDIIIFEIDDMGDKKTELTKSAFIWMARQFANFQYFLKTDDDIFVNMDALVNYLGKLNSNKLVIARDTRSWFDFVSQRLYAPDPRVPSYVISSDVVRELTRNFELEKIHGKTKFSRELYEKLNIRLRDNQGFDTGQNLQTICEVKDILTSTHVPFLRVWRYWRLVNDWVEFVTCEDGDTEIVSTKGRQNQNNARHVHKFVSVPDPHNIPMVLDHPKVCHENSPVFVVVCVISSPVHFDRRIAIRETWGRYFDPVKMVNIVTVFVLGTSTDTAIQKKILFEDNLFGDIIQGDFDDTYEHLVFKTLSLLRWVMNNCASAKYVVKVDDDVWLNFDLLLKILQPAPRSKFYLGFPRIYAPVLRGPVAKWYTPEEMYPSATYHPYQSGPAYVLSNDLVGKIFEASKTSKIFKWEDIYLGGIINKLGTYPYSSIDFDMMGLARSTCALRACAMCHKYYAKDFLYHWNLIKLKERKDIACQSNAHPYIPKFGILDTNPDRQIYVNRDHSLGQKLIENTPYRTSHSQLCRYYDDKRDPIFLLVLIFSDGADFDNRRYARVLYAKPRVINGKRVQPFFVVGSRGERDLRNLLENENRMYADLIILDQLDTKQNNTLKLELALQWVLMSCPDYRFIMKVTYKEYVNFENTVSYLSKVSSSRFVVGNVVMPTGESSSSRPILRCTSRHIYKETRSFCQPI
ncbi:uncharacterized protein [Ptychodera flava]|uniref:uncharacterized protein n=1 Tax=Ptychodera flava TaxID=63121 RepID=UPI00396A8DF9